MIWDLIHHSYFQILHTKNSWCLAPRITDIVASVLIVTLAQFLLATVLDARSSNSSDYDSDIEEITDQHNKFLILPSDLDLSTWETGLFCPNTSRWRTYLTSSRVKCHAWVRDALWSFRIAQRPILCVIQWVNKELGVVRKGGKSLR